MARSNPGAIKHYYKTRPDAPSITGPQIAAAAAFADVIRDGYSDSVVDTEAAGADFAAEVREGTTAADEHLGRLMLGGEGGSYEN